MKQKAKRSWCPLFSRWTALYSSGRHQPRSADARSASNPSVILSGRKLERRYFVYDGPGVTGWVIKTPAWETLGAEAGESAADSFTNRCS